LRYLRSWKTTAALGAASFVVPLAAYAYSASPWPDGWDYGEAQTVPYILGIFHPTGFPLYTLVGWVFSHLFAVSTVAWRLDVLSGLCVAAACLAVFALARGFGGPPLAALGAALAFAFTAPAWLNAIHAEVHALLIATIAAALVTLQRALIARSMRFFVLTTTLVGCALAIHPTAIWLVPGVVIAAIVLRRQFDLRTAGAALAGLVVPLLAYAYLPIRAWTIQAWHLDPNDAPPLDGAGASVWGAVRADSWSGLQTELSGSQFGASSYVLTALDPRNWLSDAIGWLEQAQHELGALVVVLAIAGLVALMTARRAVVFPVLVTGFGSVPFALSYAPVSIDVGRYLLPSFLLAAALAPSGVTLAAPGWRRTSAAAVVTLALFGAAWYEFALHRSMLDFHHSRNAQLVIDLVATRTPDGAIVLANWMSVTGLAYGKYVEGSLGSRLIVQAWPDRAPETIRRWTKVRRVFVDGDFILRPQIAQVLPRNWIHPVGTWDDHQIVEIVPTP